MPGLDKVRREQLELGAADWFRPYPESAAPFNQIKLDAGVFFNPSTPLPYIMGVQTSPSFVTVAAGFYRYDLVYLDASGVVQKQAGVAKALPVTPYVGAPGQPGGTTFPNGAYPIAYVLVTEDGTVVVDADDITDIRGFHEHYEPGVVGDIQADGAPASISVTGTRRFVPSAHRHPLNTDGVTPEDTDQTGPGVPGASGKYADRAHVHQVDPLLVARVATLEGAASAYMDRADTLVFTPIPGIWWYNYGLHVFQGRMRDYPGGAPSGVWVSHLATETAMQVTVDTIVAPAHGDSLAGAHVSTPQWFYVYLICKTDGSGKALVCSVQGPATGPDLSSPTFALANYTKWRFIAAIRNISDGSVPARPFEILPMVKHGRIVQYRHAQRLTYPQSAWTLLSLAEVVPLTSKLVNMYAFAWGGNGNAGVDFRTGDFSMLNPQPIGGGVAIQEAHKLRAHQGWDEENSESELSGWVETDDSQQVQYQTYDHGGVSYGTYAFVLGYDEFTDDPGSAI